MPKDDSVYTGHMLDVATKIVQKTQGVTRAQFDADENLRIVLTHLIQVAGEAARQVSEATKGKHPEIPWRAIIGMRHKIVHDYLDVDYDLVWDVATLEIPALLPALAAAVRPA